MIKMKWKVLDIKYMSETGKIRFQYEGTLNEMIDKICKEKGVFN
jgi:hypothetical protein